VETIQALTVEVKNQVIASEAWQSVFLRKYIAFLFLFHIWKKTQNGNRSTSFLGWLYNVAHICRSV